LLDGCFCPLLTETWIFAHFAVRQDGLFYLGESMPVIGCTINGGPGFKFGEGGTCFRERARAVAQGIAITISQAGSSHKENELSSHNIDSAEIKTVQHCDLLTIPKGRMLKTDQGFLEGKAPVAKTGVLTYVMNDGSLLKELVTEEALFNVDSMNSLKMKPVTNNHPLEGEVDSSNADFRQVGSTGETVEKEGEFLMTTLVVTNGDSLEDIEMGRQQLSPGYDVELLFSPGVFKGEQFDAVQITRTYNHLAIVDSARGGNDIRLRLDSVGASGYEKLSMQNKNKNSDQKPNEKEKRMKTIIINNLDYEAAPEVINHVTVLAAKVDSAETSLKTKNDEFEKLKAEHDVLKADHEKLKNVDTAAAVQEAVAARIDLQLTAHDVFNGDEEKLKDIKTLDDRDLKIKIITDVQPEIAKSINKDTGDVYLNAIMDTVKVTKKEDNDDGVGDQRNTMNAGAGAGGTQNDQGEEISAEKARLRMIKRSNDAWKPEAAKK